MGHVEQNVITVRNELMQALKVQLLGGGGIGFPEEMHFLESPKGGQSRRLGTD